MFLKFDDAAFIAPSGNAHMHPIDDRFHDREVGRRRATRDTTRIDDTRFDAVRPLISSALPMKKLPGSAATLNLVEQSRQALSRALHGQDDRLVVMRTYFENPRTTLGWMRVCVSMATRLTVSIRLVACAYLYFAIKLFAVDSSCAPLKPRLSMSATHSSSICADSLTNSSRCAAVNW